MLANPFKWSMSQYFFCIFCLACLVANLPDQKTKSLKNVKDFLPCNFALFSITKTACSKWDLLFMKTAMSDLLFKICAPLRQYWYFCIMQSNALQRKQLSFYFILTGRKFHWQHSQYRSKSLVDRSLISTWVTYLSTALLPPWTQHYPQLLTNLIYIRHCQNTADFPPHRTQRTTTNTKVAPTPTAGQQYILPKKITIKAPYLWRNLRIQAR